MRPTLFYIPSEIGGFELFGTGLFFWLILLFLAVATTIHVIRRKPIKSLANHFPVVAVILLIVVVIMPRIAEEHGFPVRGYGVFLMLAIVCSTALVLWRGKRKWNLPGDLLLSVAIVAIIFGIVGARIFYVVEYWDSVAGDRFITTLFNIFNMTTGGLVVYGSIIGGTLAMLFYLISKKMPILGTLDLFAPGLMLGIAIGRLGCFMNGCCFGAVCDSPIGVTFPVGSPAHIHQLETGQATLAGFVLKAAPSDSCSDDKTLFAIKDANRSLWTDEPGPVVIESVNPDSPAGRAGLKPGMIVRQVGYAEESDESRPGQERQSSWVEIGGNGDLFHFLYSAMTNAPEKKIFLVCQRTPTGDETMIERFVFRPDYATVQPVWPTQIFSSLGALVLCGLLLAISPFCKRDGILFASMLVLYPINRFCMELVRTDEASFLGTGLSVAQCVSLGVILIAIILFVYLLIRPSTLRYADYAANRTELPE